ncbi:glycosyltransferase family 4 protein [Candidatus Dojkabacteria bacterium]|nr:glycosyltransferase family 4 protein [Candidatus Dojkabacteria bacterium]
MQSKKRKPSIAYVMGFMGICGGNKIIYEHANRLAKQGLSVYLLHLNDGKDRGWFKINPKVKILPFKNSREWIDKIDIIIATFNETFWDIIDLPDTIKKAYFVQSDERRFYEKGSLGEYLSNATYTFKNVYYYTEAVWMQEWLKAEFEIDAPIFKNRINKEQFFPDPDLELKSDKVVVLVEGNATTPKKGVQDAAKALEDIDCEKWLLTNTAENELPDYTKIFNKTFCLPQQEKIRKIYSSADLLVKPSYFEGSPLPHMEAMCCGTAVLTTDCTGVSEYCRHLKNSYIVKLGDTKQMREAIKLLIQDPELRKNLARGGLKTAEEFLYDWDSEIAKEIEFFSRIHETTSQKVVFSENITRKSLEHEYFLRKQNLYTRIVSLENKFNTLTRIPKFFYKPLNRLLKRTKMNKPAK